MTTTKAEANARPWTAASSFGLFVLAVLAPASAYLVSTMGSVRWAWVGAMLFLACVLVLVGKKTTGESLGVLIDGRNVMSLSRFQMIAWTVLILPAFLAAGMWNMSLDYVEPLSIGLPTELWILMGISTTSLVASPLILDNKKKKRVSEEETDRTVLALENAGDKGEDISIKGSLVGNRSPSAARFSDMLTGEETGNAAHADIARIQMFFFTLIILATYAVALWRMFGAVDGQGIEAFPTIDESMVALIGISHAGYLGAKSVSHSSPPDDK